jgi:hypothetical protein
VRLDTKAALQADEKGEGSSCPPPSAAFFWEIFDDDLSTNIFVGVFELSM